VALTRHPTGSWRGALLHPVGGAILEAQPHVIDSCDSAWLFAPGLVVSGAKISGDSAQCEIFHLGPGAGHGSAGGRKNHRWWLLLIGQRGRPKQHCPPERQWFSR